MRLAAYLAEVLYRTRGHRVLPGRVCGWARSCRLLLREVEEERVWKALIWYRGAVGGEYVPVIESGTSLRVKFFRLEAAMGRDQRRKGQTPVETLSGSALQVSAFLANAFQASTGLPTAPDVPWAAETAKALVGFFESLPEDQKLNHAPWTVRGARSRLGSAMRLVEIYVRWVQGRHKGRREVNRKALMGPGGWDWDMFLQDLRKQLGVKLEA